MLNNRKQVKVFFVHRAEGIEEKYAILWDIAHKFSTLLIGCISNETKLLLLFELCGVFESGLFIWKSSTHARIII